MKIEINFTSWFPFIAIRRIQTFVPKKPCKKTRRGKYQRANKVQRSFTLKCNRYRNCKRNNRNRQQGNRPQVARRNQVARRSSPQGNQVARRDDLQLQYERSKVYQNIPDCSVTRSVPQEHQQTRTTVELWRLRPSGEEIKVKREEKEE